MKIKKVYQLNEGEEIDNFTARYYDNYDDEEDNNLDNYEENSTEYLKKIQLFEEFTKNQG